MFRKGLNNDDARKFESLTSDAPLTKRYYLVEICEAGMRLIEARNHKPNRLIHNHDTHELLKEGRRLMVIDGSTREYLWEGSAPILKKAYPFPRIVW